MLSFDIAATVTEDAYNVRASAGVKTVLPTAGTSTVKDIEAARAEVHTRLRQIGREIDEQFDGLAKKARLVAADREAAGTPVDVPF